MGRKVRQYSQMRLYQKLAIGDGRIFAIGCMIYSGSLKANLVQTLNDYEWSSYSKYLNKNELTNTWFIFSMFDNNKKILRNFMRKKKRKYVK